MHQNRFLKPTSPLLGPNLADPGGLWGPTNKDFLKFFIRFRSSTISLSALPRSPKMAPRWPKMPQDGHKMAPRWHQDGPNSVPKGPQERTKTALRRIVSRPHAALSSSCSRQPAQDLPRPPEAPPGTPSGTPGDLRRMAQDGPKKTPQDSPRWLEHCDNKRREDHIRRTNLWLGLAAQREAP